MISEDSILTQNKIIGVLLRDARLRAHKSVQACAQALSCDSSFVAGVEEGENLISLPQLEILAHLLDVPLSYFLDQQELKTDTEDQDPLPYEDIMMVRRKIIGVILRQARVESGRTLDELAPSLGYTPEDLARVELGESELSLVHLQTLAEELGISLQKFTDEDVIPLSSQERNRRDLQLLAHLPSDIRAFILKPINRPYLRIAMNLSQMPSETLRQIASGLLEITY